MVRFRILSGVLKPALINCWILAVLKLGIMAASNAVFKVRFLLAWI